MNKVILSPQKKRPNPWHKIAVVAVIMSLVTFVLLAAHVWLLLWHVGQHKYLEQLILDRTGMSVVCGWPIL
ncbi:MAG: hypothetical protein LBB40_00410 [Holophagales bacterium]|jgi:hypothetical protein|nr:hypothetical protein [Holophagales bacterium]